MNLFSLFIIATKRLWHQRLLVGSLGLGLTVAVALSVSIPLYADAVQFRLLQEQLRQQEDTRPPWAFLFRYVGDWYGAVSWPDYEPLDAYFTERAETTLGLPLELFVRHARTGDFGLYAAVDDANVSYSRRRPLLWVSLGFLTGLAEQVDLIEGQFPQASGDELEVMVSLPLAEELGLQIGERYVLFEEDELTQLPVRVVGIWQAQELTDPYWFYAPDTFDDVLLVAEDAFVTRVAPNLSEPINQAAWYLVLDGQRVRGANVAALISRVTTVQARAASLLPNVGLDVSPMQPLEVYRQAAGRLTLLLTVFSLPVLGLVLYFTSLIGGMVVSRQQNEIAVWRSRGMSRVQIVAIYAVERLVIGLVAGLIGLGLGRGLAQLLGGIRTFLTPDFGLMTDAALSVIITPTGVYFALGTVAMGLLISLWPTLTATNHTIISYKQTLARSLTPPLWQRYFLDLLLLGPPLYGYYILQQGTVSMLGRDASDGEPLQDPLLFLVPALFCFALTLLFIRIFPLAMRLLAWVAAQTPSTPLLLTLRYLARSTSNYIGPLMLLIFTLSLATFSASLALTLDRHLVEQVYYQIGADLNLAELGENTNPPDQPFGPGQLALSPQPEDEEEGDWLFLPVSEHLTIPGVQAAARVGDYQAIAMLGERRDNGRLLGIDRADFTQVAYFRPDFAGGESLGGLMNALAAGYDHVLVSRSFLARHGLQIGERLVLTIQILDETVQTEFIIAGALDLFPTVYPEEDGPFFIANLDYLYDQVGGMFPYNVWLSLDHQAEPWAIMQGVQQLGVRVVTAGDAQGLITAAQTQPQRQGLFGLLSVGFVTAAGLTVLGFLLYAVISFRRRFIELGMLRAVGLSVGQMATFLALEQAVVILTGAVVGTGLGVWISYLFIPLMQVGPQTPPFVVRIAWSELWIIYTIFGTLLAVAVVVLVALLRRMRLFEAIKLGETI